MIKCCECGKFCNPVDSGVMYGGAGALVPPDKDCFCNNCYQKKLEIARYNPEQIIIGCWWVKPNYVKIAKSVLRHKRKT
jgi:hypothetical protein